jgi:hypothetical protein
VYMADEEGDGLSSWPHKEAHAGVRPGIDIAVRVESMARQVPSQAGSVTHDLFVTLLSGCHLSIACNLAHTP